MVCRERRHWTCKHCVRSYRIWVGKAIQLTWGRMPTNCFDPCFKKHYFASSNPHPPHSRAYDHYNKFLRILETSTPNSHRPFWTLSKTTSCSAGILARSTSEYWPDTMHWRATLGYSARCSARSTELVGYSAGPPGELLWRYSAGSIGLWWDIIRWDTRRATRDLWLDTRRDPLASRSGGILGGIHWRAALAGYSAASTGEQLWRPAALAGYSAGSTGEPLWRDARRDPLASRSGRILGGIHWRAALAGYSAGSTGELPWRCRSKRGFQHKLQQPVPVGWGKEAEG